MSPGYIFLGFKCTTNRSSLVSRLNFDAGHDTPKFVCRWLDAHVRSSARRISVAIAQFSSGHLAVVCSSVCPSSAWVSVLFLTALAKWPVFSGHGQIMHLIVLTYADAAGAPAFTFRVLCLPSTSTFTLYPTQVAPFYLVPDSSVVPHVNTEPHQLLQVHRYQLLPWNPGIFWFSHRLTPGNVVFFGSELGVFTLLFAFGFVLEECIAALVAFQSRPATF